jgi:tRNA pseudouridine32 synthase / 23S rRNA pseudouridine746 synthase
MITVAPAHVATASSIMQLPQRNGLSASTFHLPPGQWSTLLDCLCASFAKVTRETWLSRFERRLVLDDHGVALAVDHPYRLHSRVHYYREVATEAVIPFRESILHQDEHLLVADKPHFLPVVPSGEYVSETLLARLTRRTGNRDLVPLHRIDRATAGLVIFSTNPQTRARYHALFREREIVKGYEAIASPLPHLHLPLICASRLVSGEPFFRMRQVDGSPNSETWIDVIDRSDPHWRYELRPVSGRKHQLRVQMAALGAPILNDDWYPQLLDQAADDYARPLQLLAKRLQFVDPLDGSERRFQSALQLGPLSAEGGNP